MNVRLTLSDRDHVNHIDLHETESADAGPDGFAGDWVTFRAPEDSNYLLVLTMLMHKHHRAAPPSVLVVHTEPGGRVVARELPITEAQCRAYADGAFLQDAFPHLSQADREFIKSGFSLDPPE